MIRTAPLSAFAPAKVNLTLDILAKRPDGYHELRSIFQTISLGDTVTVRPIREPRVELDCNVPSLATPTNSCVRIAQEIRRRFGVRSGVLITLRKRIPSGSGLGGASSDAYATAHLLRSLWRLPLPASELLEICALIGADIPFFHTGGCCLVTGIGERVDPVRVPWDEQPLTLLIAMPPESLATPAVYAAWDRLQRRPLHGLTGHATHTDRFFEWCAYPARKRIPPIGNDLWDAARTILPSLEAILHAVATSAGVRIASLTGSGSAIFGVCDHSAHARRACARIRAIHPGLRLFIARTMSRYALARFRERSFT